jgi:pseudouridine-5'-phosphate glycosidase
MIHVHRRVAAALDAGQPVMALESAVITHGLPRPLNGEVALELEAAVREEGTVPATIAVVSGAVRVGLDEAELATLATATAPRKCSRRDLALAVARGETGGTTVAATAWVAARAGIAVIATGGIGGVHRGDPWDMSADLIELGRTPITVVCSGPKSLLDLPRTMEVLETQGVPVLGYGTNILPAFYVRDSGLPLTTRVDMPAEIAAILRAREALGVVHGIVVAVPVPAEHALASDEVERIVDHATAAALASGVAGPSVTPFVLARLAELTGGRTLAANRALLANNARVAARIARAVVAAARC